MTTPPDPKTTPAHPWPPGHRQLSSAEAKEVILLGKHKQKSSFRVDSGMIGLLEHGLAVFALAPDNTLNVQSSKFGLEEGDGKEETKEAP